VDSSGLEEEVVGSMLFAAAEALLTTRSLSLFKLTEEEGRELINEILRSTLPKPNYA